MARIAGVDLPNQKRIDIALTYIYGVGRKLAAKILEEAGVDPSIKVKDLSDDELGRIQRAVDKYPVEGELRLRFLKTLSV